MARAEGDGCLDSSHLIERLFDRLPEGCLCLGPDWILRYANAAAARHLGFDRPAALGRTLQDILPDAVDSFGFNLIKACMATRVPRHFTGSLPGTATDRLTFTVDPEEDGLLIRTWATRPRLRRRLPAGFQSLLRHRGGSDVGVSHQALLANMNSAFHMFRVVRDAGGRAENLQLLDGNDHFLAYFGFKREDVVGRLQTDLWPDADPFWFSRLLDVATSGLPAHFERVGQLNKVAWEVFAFSPAPGVVAIFSIEISDRIHAERIMAARTAILEATVQELDAFGSAIAHDLRAPIRHIAGFADLLASGEEAALTGKGRHWLATIRSSAANMADLLDHLLALSRSNGREARREKVDLDALVAGVLNALSSETLDREVRWEIAPLPVVTGDPTLLREVFTNLLSNALKFTRGRFPARIEVGVREEPDEIVVSVRDNGVGFDPRQAHRLFTVFQRLHTEKQFPGSGVGLASVKRSIQRQGGRVWAEAPPEGGAVFHFALPRVAVE